MRLRKIPAATRKACRPTPAWAAAAGAPSGLVGFVTVVLVPSSFLFINENAVSRRAKYSLRQRSEPPLYWGHYNRRTEGEWLMRRLSALGLFVIAMFLCQAGRCADQEGRPGGSYQQTCS